VAPTLTPVHAPGRSSVVVAIIALVAGTATLNRDLVGVFYDDGIYASLAWAMGHGHGYAYPNLPGMPRAVHFPPLYSWLLAPLFALFGVPAAALAGKILNVLCFALAAGLIVYHAARMRLIYETGRPELTAAVVAAAALAIPCLALVAVLMSEPVFAVFVVAAIMLADRPPIRLGGEHAALLSGTAAALAFLVRSIGIAAGIGVLVHLFTTTRAEHGSPTAWRRVGIAAIPIVVAVVGWTAWVARHASEIDPLFAADYGSYFSFLRGTGLAALGASFVDLSRPLGVLTLGWIPSRALYYVLGIPALAIGVVGLTGWIRRTAAGVTLIAYLLILACWPVSPDRFLWAVLPWLALAWAAGAARLASNRVLRVPVLALGCVLALGYARYEVRGISGRWWSLASHRVTVTFEAILPALDSLPGTAVVATDHDPLVWLYTRRFAVPFSLYAFQGRTVLEPPADVQRAYLERHGVTHVLVTGDEIHSAELARLRAAYPGWLRVVRSWSANDVLFEVAHAQR